MKKVDYILSDLKERLSPKRYQHTISVMMTSASLAMCHQADVDQAILAGALHDCTKHMKAEEHIELARKGGIELTDAEKSNHHLLHARTGAIQAQLVYDIHDVDILNAIRYHTTGRADMSLLEKIVFTADYIEPGRRGLPGIERVRYLAFHDLDRCIWEISTSTLSYLKSRNMPIDERTIETADFYAPQIVRE